MANTTLVFSFSKGDDKKIMKADLSKIMKYILKVQRDKIK